jgi:hypothetical protein
MRSRIDELLPFAETNPYFASDRLGQFREAILWARADSGPKKKALSREAPAVYGISDANRQAYRF